ncbi:MAG TPA: DMT family transporter [Acetobacteraceae bacterium]|jgi:drug/metabolite transporter (DMT)-like permease|nr:DMT family transporter [Acetobacteraceae bacterium]
MSDAVVRGARGETLILASVLAFSTAGYFTRQIQQDVWTMLFWRGVFGGLFIAGCIIWRHRDRTRDAVRSVGRIGLFVAACSTIATICFVNALRLSTVADVNIIYAIAPLIAAALAWLWSGARERRSTLVASVFALCGVAVMFGAARLAGHLFGDLLAVAMTVLMSTMMVVIRQHRQVSMLPASCLSAFLSAVAVLPLAHPATAIGPQFIWFVLFGTTQFGLGLLLLTLGTRHISASRAALLSALEVPLACIWVWLAFGEGPSAASLVGGAIVMVAVVGDLLVSRGRNDGMA